MRTFLYSSRVGSRTYWRLALISFLTLYLELVVIRWLATEIRIFAYFKNFPLMASSLGFGIGCLVAERRRNYFRFAPALLLLVTATIWRSTAAQLTAAAVSFGVSGGKSLTIANTLISLCGTISEERSICF